MSNQPKPNNRKQQIAKQIAAALFGGLFLWAAFRGCDLNQIWFYAKDANPFLLILLILGVVIGHYIRACRWKILLSPLTEEKISLWNCFCAVMISYAVNLVIPRGGEVYRIVSISKTEKLPWAGVLPTMFIDRLLDIAALCLVFGAAIPILPKALLTQMPYLTSGGVLMIIGSLALLVLLPRMSDIINFLLTNKSVQKFLPEKVLKIGEGLSLQFKAGTKSLTNPKSYPSIFALTVLMWFVYWLNGYLGILALHLEKQVSLLQNYVVFAVGNIGVLVPSPGSVGGYHFFVSQALMLAANVNKDQALAYATVMHICSFVIAICIPSIICGLIQSSQSKSNAKAKARDAA